ncbi:MAG: UvrD-helicase domain-containing protein [Cloacibacillus sp.]
MMNDAAVWNGLISGTNRQVEALTSESALTVVSAGAGTGKTQTLAQRYAWLLASDENCGVNEILVLTFTKKAAREMQERIKTTLRAWSEKRPDELARLKKSADCIEDGYISTIHSFAMKMIRESGLALDIDPMSTIMPAPKEEIWWEEYQNMLSESSFKRMEEALPADWRPRLREFADEGELFSLINEFGPKSLAAAAKEASEKLYCAGRTPEELWLHDDENITASTASLAGVKDEIYKLWMEVVLPAAAACPAMEKPGVFAEAARQFAGRWQKRPFALENAANFMDDLLCVFLKKLPGNSKLKEAIAEALGAPVKEWRDDAVKKMALAAPPTEAERRLHAALCRLSAVGWACWDEFRRRERLLSLSDLIFYAGKVLSSSPDYKRKFKHIMVDEFQDTDPLQNSLIEALWVAPESGSGFQNTLFVVGDQKQSIYRFRHADLTLFGRYIEKCRGADEKIYHYVPLDQNFRTASGLLEKFNGLFGPLWSEKNDGIVYEDLLPPEDAAFRATRNAMAGPPQLETIAAVPSDDKNAAAATASELRLLLYTELGLRFAALREEGTMLWNKGEKKFAKARWRDFAVLVPSRAQYGDIERAFERLGVPYILSTNKSYFARGEIADMVNLISLLAEPEDPLYLAGWLASAFSGISQAEAELLHAEAEAASDGKKAFPIAALVMEKYPREWERLLSLRRLALLNGVSALILELLKRPFFLERYAGLRRRRVNANIIFLAQLAAEYESSQGRSLSGCAAYLHGAVAASGAKEEPDTADDETDAVRVMTIHASKGLEFPVTALVCADRSSCNRDRLRVSKKYGVIAQSVPDFLSGAGEEIKTSAWLWESEEENEAEEAERRRLWYVGFTRAQDKLILCSARKNTLMTMAAEAGLPDETREAAKGPGELLKYAPYVQKPEAPRMTLKDTAPAMLARLSASAYALVSWCPAAYRMVYRQGRTIGWTVKGGEGEGSEFGSLTHWALARWDFTAEALPPLLPHENGGAAFERAAAKVPVELRDEFASRAKRAEIRRLLSDYSQTEEARDFAAMASCDSAVKLWREMPFRVPAAGMTLIGATDLFWYDGSVLHLRDWKSSDERYAPAFYYEKQLDFYAYALRRFYEAGGTKGLPIDSAVIYLRSPEAARKVKVYGDDAFDEIEKSIEEAARTALASEYETSAARCAACPWRKDCTERVKK